MGVTDCNLSTLSSTLLDIEKYQENLQLHWHLKMDLRDPPSSSGQSTTRCFAEVDLWRVVALSGACVGLRKGGYLYCSTPCCDEVQMTQSRWQNLDHRILIPESWSQTVVTFEKSTIRHMNLLCYTHCHSPQTNESVVDLMLSGVV